MGMQASQLAFLRSTTANGRSHSVLPAWQTESERPFVRAYIKIQRSLRASLAAALRHAAARISICDAESAHQARSAARSNISAARANSPAFSQRTAMHSRRFCAVLFYPCALRGDHAVQLAMRVLNSRGVKNSCVRSSSTGHTRCSRAVRSPSAFIPPQRSTHRADNGTVIYFRLLSCHWPQGHCHVLRFDE